jgi:hypothetical protein
MGAGSLRLLTTNPDNTVAPSVGRSASGEPEPPPQAARAKAIAVSVRAWVGRVRRIVAFNAVIACSWAQAK